MFDNNTVRYALCELLPGCQHQFTFARGVDERRRSRPSVAGLGRIQKVHQDSCTSFQRSPRAKGWLYAYFLILQGRTIPIQGTISGSSHNSGVCYPAPLKIRILHVTRCDPRVNPEGGKVGRRNPNTKKTLSPLARVCTLHTRGIESAFACFVSGIHSPGPTVRWR